MAKERYIRIPEDIHFLLDFCRELLRIIKDYKPDEEIPVSVEQIQRLRSIEKIYLR